MICFDEFEMLVPNRNDSGHTGGSDGLLQEIFVVSLVKKIFFFLSYFILW